MKFPSNPLKSPLISTTTVVGGVEAGEAGTARMPPIFAGELPTQRGAGCKRLKMIPPVNGQLSHGKPHRFL